jgi:hypothetical protein
MVWKVKSEGSKYELSGRSPTKESNGKEEDVVVLIDG